MQQHIELVRRHHSLYFGRYGHGIAIQGDDLHPESGGATCHGTAGAAEAEDAHRRTVQFDFLRAHLRAVIPRLRPQPQRRRQLSRQHQEQAEGVVCQVFADKALLAGENHLALLELVVQEGIDAGGDGMNPAQLRRSKIHLPGDEAEHDIGICHLRQRAFGIRHHHVGVATGLADALHLRLGNLR